MKDLIIVGAGPVGSHLAKKFSERDKEVLIIERSEEIGKPLACSGHVSPDIWDFVPEEERVKLEQNRIMGATFHGNDDSDYRFYKEEKTVSYVINRVKLDKVKAEQAKKSGAQLHLGEEVETVNEMDEKVSVETDSEEYEAKMVAGCDGASSKVRTETGLPEPDHFYQGILCFTDEKDSSDFVDVYLEIPEFFGWRIPRTDSVEYGAAVPRGEEPLKWLDKITDRSIAKEERRNFCAGAIPIGPPEKITSERVFLVGDAAAQTKPFTGGGILYGMRSAENAASQIVLEEPESLEKYEEAWRSDLGNEIRIGKLIEKSYSWPKQVQVIGMKLFEGEIGVHMDHPTSIFSFRHIKSVLSNRLIKKLQPS